MTCFIIRTKAYFVSYMTQVLSIRRDFVVKVLRSIPKSLIHAITYFPLIVSNGTCSLVCIFTRICKLLPLYDSVSLAVAIHA